MCRVAVLRTIPYIITSFQPAQCVFFNAWASSLGSIETDYGLDNLDTAATPALFWDAL